MSPSSPTSDARDVSRSERLTYLVGTAAIALHVIDDSFLQPQPGTSAGYHLVSGLLPLGLLALAATVFFRVRAGARAAVALATGFAGLVVSAESLYYTADVGPSGDDFTGLLCVPAGFALIGLGIVTLWRSRRRNGSMARRVARRAGITVGVFFAGFFVLVPLGYSGVLTHVARTPVDEIDVGASAEEVEFETSDGVTLHGTYLPSRNGAAVIVALGRLKTQPHARMLAEHGYGVLIFDRRGEGESGGDPNPYAWDEGGLDMDAAVEFLESQRDVDRIGALGLSVGGETLIQAAADNEAIEAVVSEGASSRSVGELMSLPGSPWQMVAFNALVTPGTAVFSDSMPPEHLIDQVGAIAPNPLFLIYATEGTAGEEDRVNPALYEEASGSKNEIWEIPEAEHVGGLDARPDEYEERVTEFFADALLRGER